MNFPFLPPEFLSPPEEIPRKAPPAPRHNAIKAPAYSEYLSIIRNAQNENKGVIPEALIPAFYAGREKYGIPKEFQNVLP